jgi:hypothetical protein
MITLERFAYTPQGTFGRLSLDGFSCYTVEKPWNNNIAGLSCIPEGNYTLQKYNSPKFGEVFAVIGGTVSLFSDNEHARSTILIHPANVASDVEGCIGLGDSLGYAKGQWAVLNSSVTIKEFYELMKNQNNVPLLITFKSTSAQ